MTVSSVPGGSSSNRPASSETRASYRAATRSSPLATWQADHVLSLLRERGVGGSPEDGVVGLDLLFVDTLGDRTQTLGTPLHELGGQGLFVKEVQAAVLDGRAEFAVHSAKDLPSGSVPGLTFAAIPLRGDVRDVLIGSTLAELREGALIGTGSVRRRAQLAALRPDLRFGEVRGNVGTRISKLSQFDAIVLALAPLIRLELLSTILEKHEIEILDPSVMLPMVSQGALAIECRSDDADTLALLAPLNDPISSIRVAAERAFLGYFGAGCNFPLACLTTVDEKADVISIDGLVAAHDGSMIVRQHMQMPLRDGDATELGRALAAAIVENGGDAVLSPINA